MRRMRRRKGTERERKREVDGNESLLSPLTEGNYGDEMKLKKREKKDI